uniref:GPX4 peroxidase n=1 Tax=Fundulus heteroclitus TaxID=8078 RepID=A0A3Q2PZV4_FUNHE
LCCFGCGAADKSVRRCHVRQHFADILNLDFNPDNPMSLAPAHFCSLTCVQFMFQCAQAAGDWKSAKSIYEFSANDIDGNEVSLEQYRGHVCIIVNVASK